MTDLSSRIIVVTGATGRQGSAVTRHLLQRGWQVRALTRNPQSAATRALAALGAEVVVGDMEDPASLQPHFAGAYGVYSVQTPYLNGPDAEVRQGKHVAEVAKAARVQHLVYGSAGVSGQATGIPSWESKRQVETHLHTLGLPMTILRPMAFMELMTDKAFFPALSTWQVMPSLMGARREVGWLSTDDLGAIAAQVFADPVRFIGQDLSLTSDVQSIAQCRAIYQSVAGKAPPRLPLPPWLFRRFGFVGRDLSAMWTWLRTATFDLDPQVARAIHSDALGVEAWLRRQKG
jgi:uncharacterized protein YbjT (DUF2867 family)